MLKEDSVLVLRLRRSPPIAEQYKKKKKKSGYVIQEIVGKGQQHLLQDEACRVNQVPMLTDKDLKCTEILGITEMS